MPALVDAWFRLSFGQQQAYAIREVDRRSRGWPAGVRPAEPRDVDALVELAPLLPAVQERAPMFAFRLAPDDPAELRADIEQEVAPSASACLVAEVGGPHRRSFIVVCPVEMSTSMVGARAAAGQCYLAWAATLPAVRGTGVGLALMRGRARLGRARRGYTAMTSTGASPTCSRPASGSGAAFGRRSSGSAARSRSDRPVCGFTRRSWILRPVVRIETSADGATFTVAATGTFTPADLGKVNTVTPAAGTTAGVRFVRFTMINPQVFQIPGASCPGPCSLGFSTRRVGGRSKRNFGVRTDAGASAARECSRP